MNELGVNDLSYSCDNVVSSCAGGRPADVTGCLKVTCLGLSEDKAFPDVYNSSE